MTAPDGLLRDAGGARPSGMRMRMRRGTHKKPRRKAGVGRNKTSDQNGVGQFGVGRVGSTGSGEMMTGGVGIGPAVVNR